MKQCLSCQFYDRKNVRAADGRGLQWGFCRRDAPRLNPVNPKAHAIEGVWPMVRDDDWCGQWQQSAAADGDLGAAATALASRTPAQPRVGSVTTRTLPAHGSAAAIAAGYKPTPKPPK